MTQRIRESWRRARALLRRDDGMDAGDVILFAGTLLFVISALQFALWYMGTNVAQNAAVAAYNSARAYQATPSAGSSAGNQVVAQMSSFLPGASINIQRGATTVTVTVTGRVATLIPGVSLPGVSRTVTGPVERWVPAT